jgi:heat shock protein HspQ
MAQPKFTIGELVHHKKFDYRGVIVDVDPEFNGTEAWYELVAKSRPPKNAPWYHVLVHGAQHSTYVAERHLEPDETGEQIDHPALGEFFDRFDNGRYVPRKRYN